jgi:hypothetical protein
MLLLIHAHDFSLQDTPILVSLSVNLLTGFYTDIVDLCKMAAPLYLYLCYHEADEYNSGRKKPVYFLTDSLKHCAYTMQVLELQFGNLSYNLSRTK